jgi:hypothetical protein
MAAECHQGGAERIGGGADEEVALGKGIVPDPIGAGGEREKREGAGEEEETGEGYRNSEHWIRNVERSRRRIKASVTGGFRFGNLASEEELVKWD